MPFKDQARRNEYFRAYMRRRRAKPEADQAEPETLNPGLLVLDRDRPFTEHPRPFPLSCLAEQDGRLFDLATGGCVRRGELVEIWRQLHPDEPLPGRLSRWRAP